MTSATTYTEGNQKEAGQDSISVTETSVAEVVFILLDRYDTNLTEVTASRQCAAMLIEEPCWQNACAPPGTPPGAASVELQCRRSLRSCKNTDGTRGNRVD